MTLGWPWTWVRFDQSAGALACVGPGSTVTAKSAIPVSFWVFRCVEHVPAKLQLMALVLVPRAMRLKTALRGVVFDGWVPRTSPGEVPHLQFVQR
jgi:hypothetical protein